MKVTTESTEMFRREKRTPQTPGDVEQMVDDWNASRDVAKRLAEIEQTLKKILAPYRDKAADRPVVLSGKKRKFGHRYGNLVANAPQPVLDARDARRLLDDVRTCWKSKTLDAAVISALDLGFALCQVGARSFEPDVRKAEKADDDLLEASAKKAANTADRRQQTIGAALTLWSENSAKSLTWVQEILAGKKRKKGTVQELAGSAKELSNATRERFTEVVVVRGVKKKRGLPKLSTIENLTRGLVRPPTPPKLG